MGQTLEYIIGMQAVSMDSLEEMWKFFGDWKEKDARDIVSVLKKIKATSIPYDQVSRAKDVITQFHRQLITCGDIDDKTLELVFQVKGHIKKLEDKSKKQKVQPVPNLDKKNSLTEIESPSNFGSGLCPPNRKTMLALLYQHFLYNIKEHQEHENLKKYLIEVQRYLYQISKGDLNIYNREVKKICQHFYTQSCRTAKIRMLKGEILAKDVALNKSQAFMSDQAREKYVQNLKQESISANADFFKEHRRKIHSRASQECRFCRQKSAYCQSMKQTRSADEPMTRFMKCSKCDREWKD